MADASPEEFEYSAKQSLTYIKIFKYWCNPDIYRPIHIVRPKIKTSSKGAENAWIESLDIESEIAKLPPSFIRMLELAIKDDITPFEIAIKMGLSVQQTHYLYGRTLDCIGEKSVTLSIRRFYPLDRVVKSNKPNLHGVVLEVDEEYFDRVLVEFELNLKDKFVVWEQVSDLKLEIFA